MRYQYSFILSDKIKSFEDCPCIGDEGECEILSTRVNEPVYCKCIGDDGEKVAEVGEGYCPLQIKSGY